MFYFILNCLFALFYFYFSFCTLLAIKIYSLFHAYNAQNIENIHRPLLKAQILKLNERVNHDFSPFIITWKAWYIPIFSTLQPSTFPPLYPRKRWYSHGSTPGASCHNENLLFNLLILEEYLKKILFNVQKNIYLFLKCIRDHWITFMINLSSKNNSEKQTSSGNTEYRNGNIEKYQMLDLMRYYPCDSLPRSPLHCCA